MNKVDGNDAKAEPRRCNRASCRAPITRNKGESMRDWTKRRYCTRLCASLCSPMRAMMREEVVEP